MSVTPGEPVRLFVSTTAPTWTVTAFRIGAYADALCGPRRRSRAGAAGGGRSEADAHGGRAVDAVPHRRHRRLGAWQLPLRLDAPGAQQYVPLTVRTPSNAGRVVIINAVTTWQAYNQWGGYSLYKGPDGQRADRARAVSFDRPYERGMSGAGQFLQFELAPCEVAEHAGIPLGYATDVDLHADPHLLDGARAVITLGHDEYWSTDVRAAATAARDRGVNLAFLGGNEVYRHIRFADTPLGPNRLEINYKSFAEDPASRTDPLEATQDWRLPPNPRPESVLVGNTYKCFPGRAALVAADPANWLLSGIVTPARSCPAWSASSTRGSTSTRPRPRPIEVLFHSPVVCGTTHQHDFSDAVYYTTASGAGVFESGTQDWVCGLDPPPDPRQAGHVAQALDAITTRLLTASPRAPRASRTPHRRNLARLGITAGSHPVRAPDVD